MIMGNYYTGHVIELTCYYDVIDFVIVAKRCAKHKSYDVIITSRSYHFDQ